MREGFDRAGFDELAEAGVFSLRADGFTWADAAVVYEELGRAAVPGPLVWSVLAHGLVDGITDRLRPSPAAGAPRGRARRQRRHRARRSTTTAPGGCRSSRSRSARRLDWPLDPLTPVWRVDGSPTRRASLLAGADVAALAPGGHAAHRRVPRRPGRPAASISRSSTRTERQQFDRPIGSFQAVKHILADMAVRRRAGAGQHSRRRASLDDPTVGDLDRGDRGAKLLAGEAAVLNGEGPIQVFGGMGFTWEVDVHLYLKRAWLLEHHFGTPTPTPTRWPPPAFSHVVPLRRPPKKKKKKKKKIIRPILCGVSDHYPREDGPVIRFSVFYPKTEGTSFDHDYYHDKHVPLRGHDLGPRRRDQVVIEKGIDGPYEAAVHFTFDSPEAPGCRARLGGHRRGDGRCRELHDDPGRGADERSRRVTRRAALSPNPSM